MANEPKINSFYLPLKVFPSVEPESKLNSSRVAGYIREISGQSFHLRSAFSIAGYLFTCKMIGGHTNQLHTKGALCLQLTKFRQTCKS